MGTDAKKTTLTLDDIQMIGEVVIESEKRLQSQINDLRQIMATKKDLESMATKKDLESMSTKKDLESMVRKEDLQSVIENVVGRVVEDKFKKVIGIFPNRDEFHTRMANQAKTVQKVDQEQVVLTHQVHRIDKRVTILEKKAFT